MYSQGCIPIKWTAPEILKGHFAELSSKSDVYVNKTQSIFVSLNDNNKTFNDKTLIKEKKIPGLQVGFRIQTR